MQTCPDLPTTVDFGNNLVNYIEVSADDVPAATVSQGAGAKPSLSVQQQAAAPGSDANEEAKRQRETSVPSLDEYLHQIPKYLVDFDQPEDAPAYQYAVNAIEKLPTPPSLPGFLGKPILNAAVLIKDDNSVLNMPNHTTLNHLATSSIKYGILAVSATTRYKHKVRVWPWCTCSAVLISFSTSRRLYTNRQTAMRAESGGGDTHCSWVIWIPKLA
jgi:hypothetical protein